MVHAQPQAPTSKSTGPHLPPGPSRGTMCIKQVRHPWERSMWVLPKRPAGDQELGLGWASPSVRPSILPHCSVSCCPRYPLTITQGKAMVRMVQSGFGPQACLSCTLTPSSPSGKYAAPMKAAVALPSPCMSLGSGHRSGPCTPSS